MAKGSSAFKREGDIQLKVTRAGRRLIEGGGALRLVFTLTVKSQGRKATQQGEVLLPAR